MPEVLARTIVLCLALYALLGALYAVGFLTRRIQRVDPAAQGAGWGFRLLLAPGVIALWPLLWLRTRSSREAGP